MFQKAFQFAKDFWHSLPQWIQAGAVVFAAAAGASLGKLLSDPSVSCWQPACLKHYLGAAIGAGLVALRAFYMRPGPGRQGGPPYEGS
jgi:hypothetical protein